MHMTVQNNCLSLHVSTAILMLPYVQSVLRQLFGGPWPAFRLQDHLQVVSGGICVGQFDCWCSSALLLQMYAMPVFDMAEDLCRRKRIRSKFISRVLVRCSFVVLTAFVGISLPFFGGELFHTASAKSQTLCCSSLSPWKDAVANFMPPSLYIMWEWCTRHPMCMSLFCQKRQARLTLVVQPWILLHDNCLL